MAKESTVCRAFDAGLRFVFSIKSGSRQVSHFYSHHTHTHTHTFLTAQSIVATISDLDQPSKAVSRRRQASQYQPAMSSYATSYYPSKGTNNPRPTTGYSTFFQLSRGML